MKIDFIDYKPVKEEKHLGIATVTVDDKFMFRYKVMPGKEGKGIYFLSSNYKICEDTYVSSFEFDSNFLKIAIENVLRDNVKQYIGSVNDTEVPF